MTAEYPKLRLIVQISIVGLLILLGVVAFKAITNDILPQHEYFIPSGGNYLIGFYPDSENSDHVVLALTLKLTTNSLSAQNPIKLEVFGYAHSGLSQDALALPQKLILHCPYAFKSNFVGKVNTVSVTLNMTKTITENTMIYHVEEDIMYPFGDKYGCIILTEDEYQSDDILVKTSEGDLVPNTFDAIDFKKEMREALSFVVESSDITQTIYTNNIFITLTLSFVCFALVESRESIISGVSYSYQWSKSLVKRIKK